jgi:hypothetical protein
MTCSDQVNPLSEESSDALQVLLFETSPYGNVDAIVQHDRQSIYFFLQPRNNEFPLRACWVRNLIPGPFVINQDDLLAGRQVVLPKAYVTSSRTGPLPTPENLSIIWFEEGNAAALVESDSAVDSTFSIGGQKLLAIIPPWSGREGFHGYAAECAMDSPICWPLPKNPRLMQRLEQAVKFWSSFRQSPDPFRVLRDQLLAAYPALLGVSSVDSKKQQYYSINGDRFPPRGLMEYQLADSIALITVGMSLCPQPNVDLSEPDSQQCRRIELAIKLPVSADAEYLAQARQQLARLAGYPWRNFRWLGVGHTCEVNGVFKNSTSARLVESPNQQNQQTGLSFLGDPIKLYWLEPVW